MKIGVVLNPAKTNVKSVAELIASKLNSLDVEFYFEKEASDELNVQCNTLDAKSIYSESDVIIAVGGDGTMIHTAKNAAIYSKPVLGVNSGRVGYIAGLETNELDLLDRLVSGDYHIENRMMLESFVSSNPDKKYFCLNDVIISKGSMEFAFDITMRNNSQEFMSIRADGLITATPTGSTAYAMSAGGPVTDPSIESMIVVPICPIALYSRGLVLSSEANLEITSKTRDGANVFVTFDGREGFAIKPDDVIHIKKADHIVTRLIKIKKDSFYDVLKNKISI